MKKVLFILILILATSGIVAQTQDKAPERRPRFSPEEFQAKQRNYITEKAKLTPEEANAFFPLFFEMQKEKFCIDHEARGKVIKERGQELSDEQCKELLYTLGDAKIKVAELEKKYIAKFLNVMSAKKLLEIERAEQSFQRYMLKNIGREHDKRPKREKRQ